MKHFIAAVFSLVLLAPLLSCAQAQKKNPEEIKTGGPCEGCEAIYESAVPFEKLEPMVWLPDWNLPGRKLAVSGTVYKADGKTPAEGVIIYVYHTDQTGVYPTKADETGWAKRHGYLRDIEQYEVLPHFGYAACICRDTIIPAGAVHSVNRCHHFYRP